MTTLVNSGNGFQLPQTLTQGQNYMGGIVNFDANTGKPLATGATTTVPPAPSYNNLIQNNSGATSGGTPAFTAPSGTPLPLSDILMQIFKNAQTNNANQYTGNNTALLGGKEAITSTNADVYKGDLANANISNEARLSLLNNDQGLQSPGLKSITDQQQNNETHYNSTNDTIKNAEDQYNQIEQDKADAAKEAETERHNLAMEANKGSNVTFDTQGNIAHQTSAFELIKSAPYKDASGATVNDHDNYVAPEAWLAALNNWQSNGGAYTTFVSNFKRYLNPASSIYDSVFNSGGGA